RTVALACATADPASAVSRFDVFASRSIAEASSAIRAEVCLRFFITGSSSCLLRGGRRRLRVHGSGLLPLGLLFLDQQGAGFEQGVVQVRSAFAARPARPDAQFAEGFAPGPRD